MEETINQEVKEIRSDYSIADVNEVYERPLMQLIYDAASVHREYHDASRVQVCSLLSVKTGGCPEDCGYCPQAARYHTDVDVHKLLDVDNVLNAAQKAKAGGASRFCMGAAWREVRDNKDFDKVLEMVRGVSGMGLEVCCTMGMLKEDQAKKLKEAGLYAYNHNLDTSDDYYDKVISTRTYDDRLETLQNVRNAGLTVCCGGIIGMGEAKNDRVALLHTLATMNPHPESVPVNALVPVEGTPMAEQQRVSVFEMVRMIATARILMPTSMIRLSAGRENMSEAEQALCFMAGANSIFSGEKLLTTPNPDHDTDRSMFDKLGLEALQPHTSSVKN